MLSSRGFCRIFSREHFIKRSFYWTNQARFFSLSAARFENAQENVKLSAKEKLQMKQKLKEAKRKERIDNQRQKLLKKNADERQTSQGTCIEGTFSTTYNPNLIESKWYKHWLELDVFNADSSASCENYDQKRFVMCLPPPNVTGTIHLGHALGCSIQDAICRWQRMNGRAATWVPGCDHAGIATQVVVEKKLMRERGVSRHDLGRERFLEEVWKWKEQCGGQILEQMKRLGCSLDWSRTTFTLDPKLSRAVNVAFVRMFDEGLISRSRRLINWSCALRSAISDIEVDNVSLSGPTEVKVPGYDDDVLFGVMHTFAYPLCDSDDKLQVSTTRLETMLGDVGLAVHPDDPRHAHLIGRSVLHPITGKLLPIIADNDVSPEFGTGVLKLTPGHDMTDFDISTRHKLQPISILDDSGCLVNVPPEFMNVPRFKARDLVQRKLDSLGLFVGVADHPMSLPICSRSGDVVECVIRDQWFLDCKQMAEAALEAVNSSRLEFVPSHYTKQWSDWLLDIRDWCISRQLWWGHRIPAYRISSLDSKDGEEEERWVAAHNEQEAKVKAASLLGRRVHEVKVVQDEDVLDTWFSSALLPFSVFGWPDDAQSLTKFYPTDLLETASDIMFFWVARMVMLGEKLTGQLPFKKVLFHSIVRDSKGRKMSKSLGNVVDPMHVIDGASLDELHKSLSASNLPPEEIKKAKPILARDFPLGIPECGADALRFALCSYNYQGHVINVDVNHVRFCRNFSNKIWQSFRFVAGKIDGGKFQPINIDEVLPSLPPIDRWVLSRLSDVVMTTTNAFDSLDLSEATRALQSFWWSEFCNVYMECIKSSLAGEHNSASSVAHKTTLVVCFHTFLKLLHPFMPFLTEHLFQEMRTLVVDHSGLDFPPTVSLASYPRPQEFGHRDKKLEEEMKCVLDISSKIHSCRSLLKVERSTQIPVALVRRGDSTADVSSHLSVLRTLARSDDIGHLQQPPVGWVHVGDAGGCGLFMQMKGVVDTDRQVEELMQMRSKLEREANGLHRHPALNDSNHDQHLFMKEKIASILTTVKKINSMIDSLKDI